MNYAQEFKRRMRKHDRENESPIEAFKAAQEVVVEVPVGAPLFTIYKRSLPVGVNKPILMNLTEDDADKAMQRLKPTQYKDSDGRSHCIYYEKVLTSVVQPDDLYFNPRPVMKAEVEILRGSDAILYDFGTGN